MLDKKKKQTINEKWNENKYFIIYLKFENLILRTTYYNMRFVNEFIAMKLLYTAYELYTYKHIR